ncbi:MurR/RpiR family transcriptional regulator [Aerococcaceae bacterium zg-ZJ1578]|uniref:MurR/RpiR family transcriptional regulator n=1 Tax=Aerococcaceae bacterium zg-252 TaxID=2796928 RepID=UPI001A2F8A6E|nr:MurR/RpiR family transcriptional regulator [Aerococcaceae bacterium zg-1578]MBS4462521.1 MurR/RpiR family transcriptional regulator [Aerococcaceae bacterium zg-B36]
MNLVKKIEANFVNFSPKERLIATYLLQEQHQLKNISIHDLSSSIGTSAATITRFCRKIGCESFVELKMELQASANPIVDTKELDEFHTVLQYYNRVIGRTAELLDEEQISRVIDLLMNANRIVIYGMGSSGLTAKEFAIRLSRMGLNAIGESDSHMMIIGSAITQAGDVVIGFSNSGETKEVIHALKNAKQNKATTISITSIKGSTITKLSDEILFVHSSRFVNNDQFANTQLPFFYLVDVITLNLLENQTYATKMKTTVQEILQNTNFTEDLTS